MSAGFQIVLDHNAGGVRNALLELRKRQLPFATAVALTRVAQDARDEIRSRMPEHFKIRNKRVLRGVTIERANKKDWPNPAAKVGTVDDFMREQILGGEKKGKGGHRVSVPTRLMVARRTPSGSLRASDKPRQLRQKKDIAVVEDAIVRRFNAKRVQGTKLANLGETGRLFTLVERAQIPKRWPFEREAVASAQATYPEHFEREFGAAVKSARVREGKFSTAAGRSFYLKARQATLGL